MLAVRPRDQPGASDQQEALETRMVRSQPSAGCDDDWTYSGMDTAGLVPTAIAPARP